MIVSGWPAIVMVWVWRNDRVCASRSFVAASTNSDFAAAGGKTAKYVTPAAATRTAPAIFMIANIMRLRVRGMTTGASAASRKAARVRAMVSGGGPSGTGPPQGVRRAGDGVIRGGIESLVLIAAPRGDSPAPDGKPGRVPPRAGPRRTIPAARATASVPGAAARRRRRPRSPGARRSRGNSSPPGDGGRRPRPDSAARMPARRGATRSARRPRHPARAGAKGRASHPSRPPPGCRHAVSPAEPIEGAGRGQAAEQGAPVPHRLATRDPQGGQERLLEALVRVGAVAEEPVRRPPYRPPPAR